MKISYFCSMVKVLRYIQSLWEGVLELFYPALCPICDTPLEKGEYVCPSCHKTLRRTEQAIIRGNSTEQLFMGNKRFERGGAYLFFEIDFWEADIGHLGHLESDVVDEYQYHHGNE